MSTRRTSDYWPATRALLVEGRELRDAGDLDAAERQFRLARRAIAEHDGKTDGRWGVATLDLAHLYFLRGEWRKSDRLARAALGVLFEAQSGPEGRAAAVDAAALAGMCLARLGDIEGAAKRLEPAAVAAWGLDRDCKITLRVHWELAAALRALGRDDEALKTLSRLWIVLLEVPVSLPSGAEEVGRKLIDALVRRGEVSKAWDVFRAMFERTGYRDDLWSVGMELMGRFTAAQERYAAEMWIELESSYEEHCRAVQAKRPPKPPSLNVPIPQTLDGFADRLWAMAPPSLTPADLLELDFLAEHACRVLPPAEAVDWVTTQASDFVTAAMWKGLVPIALRLAAAIQGSAPDEAAESQIARLLGNAYFEIGRLELAEAHYLRCVDLSLGDGYEHDLVSAQYGLARLFHAAGRDEEAAGVCLDVFVTAEYVTGPDSDRNRDTYDMLAAWLLAASGSPEDAVRMMRACVESRLKRDGERSVGLSSWRVDLGRTLAMLGERDEARALWEVTAPALGLVSPNAQDRASWYRATHTAQVQLKRAHLARELGLAEAEDHSRWVVELTERVYGPRHPEVAEALTALAAVLAAGGSSEEPRALLERALRIENRVRLARHPRVRALRMRLVALQK